MTNKEKWHELKQDELRKAQSVKSQAIIDYNVMMGVLEDPEEEGLDDE